MLKRTALALAMLLSAMAAGTAADWQDTLAKAKGQTVYFNASAGGPRIKAAIEWSSVELERRFGVSFRHTKINATSDAVSRVVAEKAAGKTSGGTVDLIWINGENFAAMKQNGLLYGPWVERLPNWRFV